MGLPELEPAARGNWGSVVWAVEESGKAAALEFFEKLSIADVAKVRALLNRLAATGWIPNTEKFKKLGNVKDCAIYEFKSFQIRFLGAFAPGSRFVVALGIKKKKDRHMKEHMERAARILRENVND